MVCRYYLEAIAYSTKQIGKYLKDNHKSQASFIKQYYNSIIVILSNTPSFRALSIAEERALERQIDTLYYNIIFLGGKLFNYWDKHQNPKLYDFKIFKARKMGLTKWTPPSRYKVANAIDDYYEGIKEKIKKLVRGLSRLYFSFDGLKDPADHRVFNASLAVPDLGNIHLKNINLGTEQ